jgi:hypothetical protein
MIAIILAFLIALGGRPGSSRPAVERCSVITGSPWSRVDSTAFVIARASADSAFDGVYFLAPRGGLIRDSLSLSRPQRIYGQVARIEVVEDGLTTDVHPSDTAILVWWMYGPSCRRDAPLTAIRAPAGEEVFVAIAPRPRDQWIGGVPTYDAMQAYVETYRVYSPTVEMRRFMPDSVKKMKFMSAKEYGQLYKVLDGNGAVDGAGVSANERVVAWAKSHKQLARKQPATWLLVGTKAQIREYRKGRE